jgi:hypothetical protein
MKSVNGLVAHWRRVHHIYSDTAWLCISLPRTMSSHLSSLRVAISLTYSTGFVLLQGVVQDVCMHESLCRDWILSSKWPVGDPTWTRRSAYIVSVGAAAVGVNSSMSHRNGIRCYFWKGVAPVRHWAGTCNWSSAGLSGDTSASLPPHLDKKYVILSFNTTPVYGIVLKDEVY